MRSLFKRVPFIPQREVADCGAACVAMVLASRGHYRTLSDVRAVCGSSRSGITALTLAEAARHFGLECEGVRVEPEHLGELPLPVILHWEFSHFVVLERMTLRGAVIVDPAVGRLRISAGQLDRSFTGIALVAVPGDAFEKLTAPWPSLARYVSAFSAFRASMSQLLLNCFMLYILMLALPIGTQLLLDEVVVKGATDWLWPTIIAVGVATVVSVLLRIARAWVLQALEANADLILTRDFLNHLIHLPLSYFVLRQSGDIADRLHSNTTIRNILGSNVLTKIFDPLLLVAVVVMMIAYSPLLGSLILGLTVARVLLAIVVTAYTQPYLNAEVAAGGRRTSAFVDAVASPETTRGTGAAARLLRGWFDRAVDATNNSVQRRRADALAVATSGVLQALVGIAILLVGGWEMAAGRMTLGTLAAFMTLQGILLGPIESATIAISQMQQVLTHLRRLDDVMTTTVEQSGSEQVAALNGRISIEDVTYRYAEKSPAILDGVSIDVAAGELLGIVGRSGAGKSTLIRLMAGLLRPTSGSIRYDGFDLASLNLPDLRKRIGIVLQEGFLFEGTLYDNLTFGSETASDVELAGATRIACLDTVLSVLPRGLETNIGPNGSHLSGGQRQRICIARALLRKPAILVLDEATSALDEVTERQLHSNLRALNCTRIVIAHRMSTLREADRIVLLHGGRVVQEGTFDDLIRNAGQFRELAEGRLDA